MEDVAMVLFIFPWYWSCHGDNFQGCIQEHTFVFRMANEKACKHVWKCAIEHHTFFRLCSPGKDHETRQNFIRMGSKFRYRCLLLPARSLESILVLKINVFYSKTITVFDSLLLVLFFSEYQTMLTLIIIALWLCYLWMAMILRSYMHAMKCNWARLVWH